MNTKNRLIDKLLGVAKRHKILTYPVLALVALISIFSYFFNWSTGAGKRVVAVVMVMVMLVSQSYFLTSSATDVQDDPLQVMNAENTDGVDIVDGDETLDKEDVLEGDNTGAGEESQSETNQGDNTGKQGDDAVAGEVAGDMDTAAKNGDTQDLQEAQNGEGQVGDMSPVDEDTTEEPDVTAGEVRVKLSINSPEDGLHTYEKVFIPIADKANHYKVKDSAGLDSIIRNYTHKDDTKYYEFNGWYISNNADTDWNEDNKLDVNDLYIEPGTKVVQLYGSVKVCQYKVKIALLSDSDSNEDDRYDNVTIQDVTKTKAEYYDVPVGETISINNIRRTGYTISSNVTITNGKASGRVSTVDNKPILTISIDAKTAEQTIYLDWNPGLFEVQYANDIKGKATSTTTVVLEYGSEEYTWADPSDPAIGVKEKPGYYFKDWEVYNGNNTTVLHAREQISLSGYKAVLKYLFNNEGKSEAIIYPTYTYRGISVKENNQNFTYSYKEENPPQYEIKAYYTPPEKNPDKWDENDRFQYNITSTTIDGRNVNLDSYGINIDTSHGAIIVRPIVGGPTDITEGGSPIKVTFKVTDPDADADNGTSEEFTFTITIKKKRIKVIPLDQYTKVYDGTPDCNLTEEDLPTYEDGIFVNYSTAEYDDIYASENRVIKLKDGSLKSTDPEKQTRFYCLESDDWTIPGVITKRPIYVSTYAEYNTNRNYARAGEDNPDLSVSLTSANNTPDAGIADTDKGYNFVRDIIEAYAEYKGDERQPGDTDLEPLDDGLTRKYEVKARVKKNLSDDLARIGQNYYVYTDQTSGVTAEFTLKLEKPEQDVNYEFSLNQPVYDDNGNLCLGGIGNEIRPKGDYNLIRVETESGWSAWVRAIELTEANTMDGVIKFQLKDDSTGAFTSWKKLDLNVDSTAPRFERVEVRKEPTADKGDGFFFPSEGRFVSFGNYFDNTIYITLTYRDDNEDYPERYHSNPKYLYYSFSGTLGSSEWQRVEFGPADENGFAQASIEIYADLDLDKMGTIKIKAEDYAGNVSGERDLTRQGKGDTEWAVEQSRPEITQFYGRSISPAFGDRPIDSGNNYYANCTVYLNAEDDTSGIYGVTWYVATNRGTGTSTKQIAKRLLTADGKELNSRQNRAAFSLAFKDNPDIPAAKDGVYTVYATVTDNAGNVSEKTKPITFIVDDEPPIIEVDDYDDSAQQVRITFRTYDKLSGFDKISIYKDGQFYGTNVVTEWEEESEEGYTIYHCYFDVDQKGLYKIIARDRAGNEAYEIVDLGGVSGDMPDCPEVTFNPEVNEKGWITSKKAKAHLENVLWTSIDKMESSTHYALWLDGEKEPMYGASVPRTKESYDLPIPEGYYHLHVWGQSDTGVKCPGADGDSHYYDLFVDGTAPIISYQLQRGSDNSVTVTFTITDAVAGVNKVSGVDKDTIKVLHGKEPILISLEELESGDGYTGTFKVTENGSYTIQAADVAGNVADEEAFSPMSIKVDAVKNITKSSSAVGAKIYAGTYDIKAVSIAYRKTTDTVYTETDAVPILNAESRNMTISAVLTGLAEGTDYVYKITAVSEGNEVIEYEGYFRTLSDADVGVTVSGVVRYSGDRNITVDLIKGNNYIRGVEILVESERNNYSFTFTNVPDGSYNLVATDGVDTKSIRVLVEGNKIIYPEKDILLELSNQPSTSVDIKTKDTPDVSAEFNWLDNLLTDEDRELIENGGNVEYKLTASIIRITNIETAALSAMYAVAGTDKVVGAYLDLNLYKIVTDEDGNVTQKRVSELLNGASVSVTIPLGDMTGKSGLMVVRIHQIGSNYTGRYLPDEDINPSTYTLTTNQFSTYAVLYDRNRNTDSTNGNVNRGDTVINGSNNSSVKKDVTAVEMSAEESESGNKTNNKTNTSSNTSVSSLRNASTAKTGDEAPIAFAGIMMMFAMGGFVVLRKKANKN